MNVRYVIYIILFCLAVLVQWPLWFGKGGILKMYELESDVATLHQANEKLRMENNYVAAEIESLENGRSAVEEHARMQLGMIREDEVLFRMVPKGLAETNKKATKPKPYKRPSVFKPKNDNLYIAGEIPPDKEKRPAKTKPRNKRK